MLIKFVKKEMLFPMNILSEGLFSLLADGGRISDGTWQYYTVYALLILFSICSAYLLGSINSAIIVSKTIYREDIRSYGSGNAGLTNVLRTYGKGAAALTLVGDMLKTALAILVAGILLGFSYSNGISIGNGYCYLAGLFAVIGHIFPVYYGFRGGKGVLATSTMALILTPIEFLILLALFVGVVFASKYVSLGSVCAATLLPVLVSGYVKFLGLPTPALMMLSLIILAIFIVWCHRENLKRISDRTERKISFGKGKKEKIEEKKADDAE